MRSFLMLLIPLLFVHCSNDSNQLSRKERDFVIAELNKSKDNLLGTVNALTEIQLNYKPNEASWSIAECTEHITIFVDEVFEILEESLELPADPERRKGVKFSDKELIAFVQDRTDKAKTQEDYEPRKIYGNHPETIEAFNQKMERHANYIKTTKDDLRNHYTNFGTVDTYQIFLYMSAHTNRHVEQIKEIKNSKNFPKN